VGLFKKEEQKQSELGPKASLAPPLVQQNNSQQRQTGRKEKKLSLKTDEITTILGRGSEFEGKLQFEGTLQIEGVFSGEIISDSVLVIGKDALVKAEIDIGTIIINGEVRGNIRAKQSVEIKHPGRVFGNLETPALTVDKGVIFEGNSKMENLGAKGAKPSLPIGEDKKEKDKKEEKK